MQNQADLDFESSRELFTSLLVCTVHSLRTKVQIDRTDTFSNREMKKFWIHVPIKEEYRGRFIEILLVIELISLCQHFNFTALSTNRNIDPFVRTKRTSLFLVIPSLNTTKMKRVTTLTRGIWASFTIQTLEIFRFKTEISEIKGV